MSADVVAVIPARLGSTRLPNKVLCDLGGAPMIARVIERVRACAAVDQILVATDAEQVAQAVEGLAVQVVQTGHASSGTDRVAQALAGLGLTPEIVLNVQGDEPFVDPELLGRVVEVQRVTGAPLVTACAPIRRWGALLSPDVVKVVPDAQGRAMIFSRSPVPWSAALETVQTAPPDPSKPLPEGLKAWEHIGIYGFTGTSLHRFTALPPHPLELQERLEQLRALAFGWTVELVEAEHAPGGIDTPEELEAARARLERSLA